ncbi:hypothetical protein ACVBGC_28380 [Burkholderia stagnalis]
MSEFDEKTGRSDIDDAFAQASRMIAALLRVTSLERVEDVDAYVGSLEAIVFEFIGKYVDRPARGAARSAYKQGVAAGFQGVGPEVRDEARAGVACDARRRATGLLEAIRQAGEDHGRAIRRGIAWGV